MLMHIAVLAPFKICQHSKMNKQPMNSVSMETSPQDSSVESQREENRRALCREVQRRYSKVRNLREEAEEKPELKITVTIFRTFHPND